MIINNFIGICKYKCMNCKPEDHADQMKEEEDESSPIRKKWEISSGEEEDEV